MHTLSDLEIGVLQWATGSCRDTLRKAKSFDVRCGQIGIPGDFSLEGQADDWNTQIESEEFHIETLVCSYDGESYTDLQTVIDTVGFLPAATRDQRIERTKQVSDFAAALEVENIACHIGFVPENREHAAYAQMRDLVADICDHCAKSHQNFALETGQEPAKILLQFIKDVDRSNLKVNFDPANMILYGTGNPLEAVEVLAPLVVSVHCKDGDWPALDKPNLLGQEKPLGKGSVDIPAFISKLKETGYRGQLFVEREEPDQARREADVRQAIAFLRPLVGETVAA